MTNAEKQEASFSNATGRQGTFNYGLIFDGFLKMGIPEQDIKPRENIFTFNAWRYQGRTVKKGEHGVTVCVFITTEKIVRDPVTGKESTVKAKKVHHTTVFHVSQTKAIETVETTAGPMPTQTPELELATA